MKIKDIADSTLREPSPPAKPIQKKPVVLKPVHPTFYICKNNCLPVQWTLPRHEMPPELQVRGVDLSTWNQTFGKVRCLFRKNSWIEWVICPFFYTLVLAPCVILMHKAQEQGNKNAFRDLAEKQECEVYGKYGIRVTVVIDNNIYGGQCDVDEVQFKEYVGLRFTLLNETKDETQTAEVENKAAIVETTMERWWGLMPAGQKRTSNMTTFFWCRLRRSHDLVSLHNVCLEKQECSFHPAWFVQDFAKHLVKIPRQSYRL